MGQKVLDTVNPVGYINCTVTRNPVRTDIMFDVQYNRNTFNPHFRKSWQHAHRADTLEEARRYLRTTRAKFKNEFGYPSDVEYRIVEVKKD